jgi:hypothetical protein
VLTEPNMDTHLAKSFKPQFLKFIFIAGRSHLGVRFMFVREKGRTNF